MSKDEIKTGCVSAHYTVRTGMIECPKAGWGFDIKCQPVCIGILCHRIETLTASYWELCHLGDYLYYRLSQTTIVLLFKEDESRLKRSESSTRLGFTSHRISPPTLQTQPGITHQRTLHKDQLPCRSSIPPLPSKESWKTRFPRKSKRMWRWRNIISNSGMRT